MKKNLTLVKSLTAFALLFLASFSLSAQGSAGDGFTVRIAIDGKVYGDFPENSDCGVLGTDGWGGDVTKEITGDIVWGLDGVGNDSLLCDSVVNSYAGKIVMARRGVCEFGRKALWAQKAGAIAVIIFQDFRAGSADCNVLGMGSGAVGNQVTIPVISAARYIGQEIDAQLKAGKKVTGTFLLPRFLSPTGAYQFMTPVSQVSEINGATAHFINRAQEPITNVVIKADFLAPNGTKGSVSTTLASIPAGKDTLVILPPYTPPAVKGTHKIVFSNNKFTESRDTLTSYFQYTDHTFGTDVGYNEQFGAGFLSNAQFAAGQFFWQAAGLVVTGSTASEATHATFGISNADSVYVPGDDAANAISVTLYDADPDANGTIDLGSSFNDLASAVVATATYTMKYKIKGDSLVSVPLTPVSGTKVELKKDHAYYISISYDGTAAGHSRCLTFADTPGANEKGEGISYLAPSDAGFLTTPVYFSGVAGAGPMYSGFGGPYYVIHRLQLKGFDPSVSIKPELLDEAKIQITPNPASDVMRVSLKLDEVNPSVAISLMDESGRLVRTEVLKNYQSGVTTLNVQNVPSGHYLVWVRTSEGSTMKQVSICH